MRLSKRSMPVRPITSIKIAAILVLFVSLCVASPGRDTQGKQAGRSKNVMFSVTLQDSSKGKNAVFRANVSKRDSGAVVRDGAKTIKTAKTAADTASGKSPRIVPDSALTKTAKRVADTSAATAVKSVARKADTAAAKPSFPKADSFVVQSGSPRADTVAVKNSAHPADSASFKPALRSADAAKQPAAIKRDTVSDARQALAKHSVDSSIGSANSQVFTTAKELPKALAAKAIRKPASHRMLFFRILVFFVSVAIIFGAVRLVRKNRQPPRFLSTTRLSVMDKEVQKACRYIEKNYSNPELTVKSICADLVTGEAFLHALMERDLGISVEDFIAQVRINGAKLLLEKASSINKEDIAQRTGFPDTETFLATFKRLTGATFETYSRLKQGKA
jgi:methylphosphotriester-DNA--protein-cysteine methyltransferase